MAFGDEVNNKYIKSTTLLFLSKFFFVKKKQYVLYNKETISLVFSATLICHFIAVCHVDAIYDDITASTVPI